MDHCPGPFKWTGFTIFSMTMDKEKFLKSGLLEQYVLGLTDEKESEEVERYAEAFPEIKEEIESMRKAVDEYARQYAVMPPEELKSRVMKETDELEAGNRKGNPPQEQARQAGGARWGTWLARGIMALLIVLSLSFYRSKVAANREYEALSREYRAFQLDCSRQQAEQEKRLGVYAFLKNAHTRPILLSGTGLAPDAEAIAYFNEEQKEVFINPTRLPDPPKGKTYQIWADVNGEMIDMGLIDCQNKEIQAVAFIEGTESLNITLEPEGGSKEPTLTLLYVNSKV